MKFCLFVLLLSFVLYGSCAVCTGEDCIESGFADFGPPDRDTIISLEKNPGATSPLASQWENPGPAVPNLPGVPGKMPASGPEDAPVRVHLFSDFQCPVCRRAVEPFKWLIRNSEFAGKVRFVFVNYALPSHRHARAMGIAGLAAGRQNLFWEFWDTISARVKPDNVVEHASKIKGLDVEKFKLDMLDSALADQIDYETALSAAIGIRGTPGICINGKCGSGWSSYFGQESLVRRSIKALESGVPTEWQGKESMYAAKALTGSEGERFYDLMYAGIENLKPADE